MFSTSKDAFEDKDCTITTLGLGVLSPDFAAGATELRRAAAAARAADDPAGEHAPAHADPRCAPPTLAFFTQKLIMKIEN